MKPLLSTNRVLSSNGLEDHSFLHILQRDQFTCQFYGNRRHLEIHHMQPPPCGGVDDKSNLITLCHSCHAAFHARNLGR